MSTRSTPAASGPGAGLRTEQPHAQAPIRWPHPDRTVVSVTAVWAVGLLVGLLVPALIVGPGEDDAPVARIWLAFAVTAVGAAIMLSAALVLWRRTRENGVMIMGAIPGFALVFGGVIIAASKIFER